MATHNFKKGSINIFGLGIRLVSQVTLETNYLLQETDVVFHMENNPVVSEYIVSLNCKEINLSHLYEDGKSRDQTYQEICDAIIEAAKAGNKCAYLAPGNPIFLNSIVEKLRAAASIHEISFSVFSGVSSIDTLLTDLFLPAGNTGLQCYEATHFVRIKPTIDKRVPLMLFQPAVVEMYDVHYHKGGYLEGVSILQDALVELYGRNQKWCLLRSAMTAGEDLMITTGILSQLTENAVYMDLGTLFIPGEWNGIEKSCLE